MESGGWDGDVVGYPLFLVDINMGLLHRVYILDFRGLGISGGYLIISV